MGNANGNGCNVLCCSRVARKERMEAAYMAPRRRESAINMDTRGGDPSFALTEVDTS